MLAKKQKSTKTKLINEENMPDDVIKFKQICQDLYDANNAGATYDEVVNLVLRTPYGDICRGGELTLNEIGFIFGVTRERIRQKELDVKKILTRSTAVKKLNDYLSTTGEDRISKKHFAQRAEKKLMKKYQWIK
jgi:DNA-directed RNA polymerase sigma subunit (sigma70/sigma32)